MQIQGPVSVHGAHGLNGPHRARTAQPTPPQSASGQVDQLDISSEADLVSRAREIDDIRTDRVAEIKSAIESGAYETDEKLDIAIDRLLDELV